MAKESYWFKHDFNSRSDPKLVKLTIKYGMEGIGLYWCIIELMYEQGGYLSVSDIDIYAHSFRVKVEMFDDIIKNFKLFAVDEDRFWSNRVLIGREEIDGRVSGAKKAIKARWDKERAKKDAEKEALPNDKVKNEINIPFDSFWELYDNKKGRKDTEKKWNKLSDDVRVKIMAVLPKYLQSTPNGKFRMNPETYLNGEHWNDEIKILPNDTVKNDKGLIVNEKGQTIINVSKEII